MSTAARRLGFSPMLPATKKTKGVVGPFWTLDYKLRRDAVELQYGIAIWTVYPDGQTWIDADTKLPVVWP